MTCTKYEVVADRAAVRSRWRGQSGAAFVELAATLPLLALVVLGTADFGRVFYYAIELSAAARAGVQYGAQDSIKATDTDGITAAAQSAAPNINLASGDVTVTVGCACAADGGTGYPWTYTAATCSTTCTVGNHMLEQVKLDVRKRFRTVSFYPGIPNDLLIARTAKMRVAF